MLNNVPVMRVPSVVDNPYPMPTKIVVGLGSVAVLIVVPDAFFIITVVADALGIV
jgi:hypothetical protein